MSLFPGKTEKRAADPVGSLIPTNGQFGATSTNAGEYITMNTALRLGTVWACVNFLSELVGVTIDYHSFDEKNGVAAQVAKDPIIYTNPDSTTPNLDAYGWRRQIIVSWLLRGNAWGLVKARDFFGRATSIQIIHPDWVTVTRRGIMGPFTYRVLGTELQLYSDTNRGGDLWHKPAHVGPGSPIGLSPIAYGAQSMGLGIAAEDFGAKWFGDGATPSSVLTSDQVIDDPTAKSIKARFVEAIRGTRAPAVLGSGLTYEQISVAAEESQFLDTIKANRLTIAQFFGLQVAPELVGAESAGTLTYSNTEQQNLNVLTYGASGWVSRMENIYTELTPSPQFCAADLSRMLRVDAKTKADIEAQDLIVGKRSQNEVRGEDNLAPVPGGNRLNFPPKAVAFDHMSASGVGDAGHPLAGTPAASADKPAPMNGEDPQ